MEAGQEYQPVVPPVGHPVAQLVPGSPRPGLEMGMAAGVQVATQQVLVRPAAVPKTAR